VSVLRIDAVVKRRGARRVVDAVSLAVGAGERVALLGHNGAGKTTLMRMVLGLTAIDAGRIEIADHAAGSLAARRLTSYLPENVAFHRALTGREALRHFARLRGEPKTRADDLLDRVGLAGDAGRRIATYSKGMCQRLGLAQALLGRPRLALLDEPTSGLDPVARYEFYGLIDELANDGGAVLLSSHALTELEARTDRIAILRAGRLVADDTLPALRRAAAFPIRIRLAGRPDSAEALASAVGGRRLNGCLVELECAPEQKMQRLAQVGALQHLVTDVEIVPAGLDELYRHYSGSGAST